MASLVATTSLRTEEPVNPMTMTTTTVTTTVATVTVSVAPPVVRHEAQKTKSQK